MSHHQYKLFEYTKANDLLVGDAVVEADKTRVKIKQLQKQGKIVPDWKLNIFCRDPTIITHVIIEKIDQNSGASSYGSHAISIVIDPVCIRAYNIPISFLNSKEEATALLETVQAYLRHRYGI